MQFNGAVKYRSGKEKTQKSNAGVESTVEVEDQLNGSTNDYDLTCRIVAWLSIEAGSLMVQNSEDPSL